MGPFPPVGQDIIAEEMIIADRRIVRSGSEEVHLCSVQPRARVDACRGRSALRVQLGPPPRLEIQRMEVAAVIPVDSITSAKQEHIPLVDCGARTKQIWWFVTIGLLRVPPIKYKQEGNDPLYLRLGSHSHWSYSESHCLGLLWKYHRRKKNWPLLDLLASPQVKIVIFSVRNS